MKVVLYHSPNQYFKHHLFLLHKELNAIYASYFIKLFGESFISVFTAIYLLVSGYNISQVAIYYIIYFVVAYVITLVARSLMRNFGVIKTLALGTITYVSYYFLLQKIAGGTPYQLVAIVYGIASGLYFSAFNVELSHALRRSKNEGMAVAIIRILAIASGIIGPLVGSIFITKISFQILFSFVAVLLIISLLPLLFVKDYKANVLPFSAKRVIKLGNKRRALVYGLNGAVGSGLDILWPAFIYLNYRNLVAVGGIISATSLIISIIIYLAGKYSDLYQVESYKIGVLAHAPTWLMRLVLLTPGGLLASNFLSTMTAYLVDIPFSKSVYHSANISNNPTDYFIFMGTFLTIGRVAILACAALTQNFTAIFALISILTLLHLLLIPELRKSIAVSNTGAAKPV